MPVLAFVETSLSGSGYTAIRYASALGAEVLFLTREPAYYPSHGAIDPRDVDAISEVVICETNDVGAIVRELKSRHVSAVLSAGEYHVEHASRAAQELRVFGLSAAAAGAARHKRLCYEICAAAGIRVPAHAAAATDTGAVKIAGRLGYPCVVKPVDGTASTAVRYCLSQEEVAAAAGLILGTRRNPRGQRCAGEVMVTEYLTGPEVSVETLSHQGVTLAYGVTDKHLTSLPYFVETGHTFPSARPRARTSEAIRVTQAALAAIGLDNGMAHTELKLTEAGPVLLEINARPAGDHITELIRIATGTDPLEEWMRAVLGRATGAVPNARRAASIHYLTPPAGRVVRVAGEAQARSAPGVVSLSVRVSPGDLARQPRSSHDRSGYVIAAGAEPVLAERAAETAASRVLVLVESPK